MARSRQNAVVFVRRRFDDRRAERFPKRANGGDRLRFLPGDATRNFAVYAGFNGRVGFNGDFASSRRRAGVNFVGRAGFDGDLAIA